ncbi:MAG TPA: LiaF domain-containing protein [Acidimicrobiia bacterium]|nr:LiaF domain-containing protein [Acidimicrobiia bacterium]
MSTTETLERSDTPTGLSPKSRHFGAVVTGSLLMIVGGLWLLDVLDVIELEAAIVLPAVLIAIGLALTIGAFSGPHAGLVVAGVFVTIAVLAAAATPPDAFNGGIGERTVAVTNEANLAPQYNVGLGELRLDLSDLNMTEPADVAATVGAGDLIVFLPPDLPVTIDASAGAGEIDLLGEVESGISVSRSYTSDGFDSAAVTLTLELDVAAGNIKVER